MNPGQQSSRDKRRAGRARVSFSARYSSASLSLEGFVTDLSPDGVFFSADYLDAQGEQAVVSIDLPSRVTPLELRGEVRWVKDAPHGCGMGIRLIDVGLEERELLRAHATGNEPRPAEEHFQTNVPTGNA